MRWWLAADLWADWGLVHTGIVGSAGLLGAEQFLDAVGQRRRDDAVRRPLWLARGLPGTAADSSPRSPTCPARPYGRVRSPNGR